jgi:hypothetical protein
MNEIFINCIKDYEISNFGNCRRLLKNGTYKIIKGSLNRKINGYKYFNIIENKIKKKLYFHHLVARHFIGERPEKLYIDHVDRNTLNNNVCNLRYVTPKANAQNTIKYRTDILSEDRKERKKIFSKEYRIRQKVRKYLLTTVLLNLVFQCF